MDTELIKLKIKTKSNSVLIKETFLKACQNLNASLFEELIDEEQYFQELDKYRFLDSMKTQFDYLITKGIKSTVMKRGVCKMCYLGEKVYEFYSDLNQDKPVFAYNIKEDKGKIKDIFRCNFSDGYQRASRDNKNPDITYLF